MTPTREDIIKAAKECGAEYPSHKTLCVNGKDADDFVTALYLAAYRAGLERGAVICDERYRDCMEPEMREIAEAIRKEIECP